MTEYPHLEPTDYAIYDNDPSMILHLSPDRSVRIGTKYDIRKIAEILLAYLDNDLILNFGNLNGLVTIEKEGQEIIQGWYGHYSSAQLIAKRMVKTNRTAGARAYVLIGEYGKYENEAPIQLSDEDLDDEEPQETEDTAQTKMDRWFN